MTLKEYLDKKRKKQIRTKENRPMKVKVKEVVEYYARMEREERDSEKISEQDFKIFISEYIDENRND